MRILFVADGRSPIALNWIRHWVERGDDVHLASTFSCRPELDLRGIHIVPVAFSGLKQAPTLPSPRRATSRTLLLRTVIRQWLGPLTISRSARKLREIIKNLKPDLIHAMRIPYEGMLAADAYSGTPLIVSVWGNDFTLHAQSTPLMGYYTRWTMRVADALHTDCQRDIQLARKWDFSATRPSLVTPGNGGIRTDIFYPPEKPVREPVVINPRGFRTYVRNDTFFRSIPLVLDKIPETRFLCTSMAHEPKAIQWIEKLGIQDSVDLLAPMPHHQMAEIYRRAAVLVSPSQHDGTPNSLLEGMASGCFPVTGDLESIREWISAGENGILVDPTNPRALAQAVIKALENKDLRIRAAGLNKKQILENAEYGACMSQAESFYQRVNQAI